MLDGLVIQASEYKYPLTPIYTKTEKALDVERIVFYYPNCEIHSIVKYFDPRRDKEHKTPRRIRIHRVMSQFENFMFSQLSLEEICEREVVLLDRMLEMKPEQLYFELVVQWYHSEGWAGVFQPFGGIRFADDMIFIRRKVKLAKYFINGIDFKFYRMNPEENREHSLKYPFGWMGLTKCEIPTPIFKIETAEDLTLAPQVLLALQKIREALVGAKWEQIQCEVGAKTYARSDAVYAWSANDQNLRGTLKLDESELTKRPQSSLKAYLNTVEGWKLNG